MSNALLQDLKRNLPAAFFSGSGEKIPDSPDGGASLTDEAPDVGLVHGEYEGGLVTLLTVIQQDIVRMFDKFPHHVAQELVH